MKDFNKFKFLFGCLCVSMFLVAIVPVYGDGAIFYPDRAYGGTPSQEFGAGSYTMSDMIAKGINNDDAQSIQITWPGWSAITYQGDNFTGGYDVWTDWRQIMDGFENTMSSVEIQRGVPSGHVYARYKSWMPAYQAGYLYGDYMVFSRGQWVHLRSSEGMCGYTIRWETEYWVNSGGIRWPSEEVISGQNVLLGTNGGSDPGTCTGTAFPWESYYWLDGEVKWTNLERTTDEFGTFYGCSYNLAIRDGGASLPTPPATPDTPNGVSASAVTDGIEVSWNAASGATGYRVKRATSSGGPYTALVADTVWQDTRIPDTSTSFIDATVNPFTTYYYVVTAVNAGGDSADSSQVSATSNAIVLISQGKPATASSSESGNVPANGNDGDLSSRWTAVDGSYPQWWKVELDSEDYDITQVAIDWHGGIDRSYKYKIEVSNDDINYTTVVDQTARTEFGSSVDTFNASARYVRVTVTGVSPSGGWAAFYECKVFGSLGGPPSFDTDPINEIGAIEETVYSSTLADDATDPDGDPMTFSKEVGPDWLTVAEDGTLSGIPKDSDVGANEFTVRVTDSLGLYDTAQMTIQVANIYSGTQGMEDLLGLADQWLIFDCGLCGGANLDGSNGVTVSDFAMLGYHWLVDYDLQLWLKLDEMSGDIAGDSSFYDRPGQLINAPIWSAGYAGGALEFDGSNYVEIAHDPNLNPDTDSWSVAFWMKSDTSSQGALIVSKRGNTNPYPGYLIGLSNGSPTTFTAGSKLTFLLGADSGDRKGGYTTDNLQDIVDCNWPDWTHVCVVLDQDADTAYIYINGVSVPIIRTPDDTLSTINTTTPVYIGQIPSLSSKPYYGLIDEVRIYNVALSEQEVQNLSQ